MKVISAPWLPGSLCLVLSGDAAIPSEWEKRELPESPKRRRELLLGRVLLREAVLRLTGIDPGWIESDENRIPHWPAGVQGSLSHTGEYVAVWAHRGKEALGLDLQPWLDSAQTEKLKTHAKKRGIELPNFTSTGLTENEGLTLLFCIQESVQKCLGNRGLSPVNLASLRIEKLDSHSWSAKIEEKTQIHGQWLRYEGLCVTFGAL